MSDGNPRQLLDFLVGSIVAHPDAVAVDETDDGKRTLFEVTVHEDDLAALQAGEGTIGEAIKTVVDACAYKHRLRIDIESGA